MSDKLRDELDDLVVQPLSSQITEGKTRPSPEAQAFARKILAISKQKEAKPGDNVMQLTAPEGADQRRSPDYGPMVNKAFAADQTVTLQSKDGKPGAVISRKMFDSDEEFKKFVKAAEKKGALRPGPAGSSGGFWNNVRNQSSAEILQATPNGASPQKPDESAQQIATAMQGASAKPVSTEQYLANGPGRPDGTNGGNGVPLQEPTSNYGSQIVDQIKAVPKQWLGPLANIPGQVAAVPDAAKAAGQVVGADAVNMLMMPLAAGDAVSNALSPPMTYVDQNGKTQPIDTSRNAAIARDPLTQQALLHQQSGGRMGGPSGGGIDSSAIDKAVEQQVKAIRGAADIEGESARAKVAVLDAQEKAMVESEARRQQAREQVNARVQELLTNTQKVQETLNNPAKTPDPERYWQGHSKVMFAIGVGLLAQAKGDIGAVLANVRAAIDNDIQAQKDAFEAPRAAAREKIAANNNLIALYRQQGHDTYEAERASQAFLLQRTALQVERIGAQSENALVQQKAEQLAGSLKQAALEKGQEAVTHRMTGQAALINANTNRMEASSKISLAQGALKSPFGKLSEADRNKLSETEIRSRVLNGQLNELRGLVKQYGTGEKVTPGVEGRMKRLALDTAIDTAKFVDPGNAAREGEVAAQMKEAFQPGFMQREASVHALLDQLQSNIARRRMETYGAYGVPPPDDASAAPVSGYTLGPAR